MDSSLFHPLECDFDTHLMRLNDPFDYVPHPLVAQAALEVERMLLTLCSSDTSVRDELQWGKMLGVLVVRDVADRVGFLAAFSGMLAGQTSVEGFVPPIYDLNDSASYFRTEEQRISDMSAEILNLQRSERFLELQRDRHLLECESQQQITDRRAAYAESKQRRSQLRLTIVDDSPMLAALKRESQYERAELRRFEQRCREQLSLLDEELTQWQGEIENLKRQRAELSNTLQCRMFESYRVVNGRGEWRSLLRIFDDMYHCLPPAATGDCAAPKLLQYALCNGLKPLAIGEFWHGASPKSEVRHHGQFYGACRGRCYPVLTFMLQGIDLMPSTHAVLESEKLQLLYDDDYLAFVNKPAGMLSVAGRTVTYSVESEVRRLFPDASGAMMVHRLDQDTSGVMVIAKSAEVHRDLQRQFAMRTMTKRYIAIVDGVVASSTSEGDIRLPLSSNFEDRPRQRVDFEWGKEAHTTFELLSVDENFKRSRLALYPHTGRTHQLRVHMAHSDGLGMPIVGDRLYGRAAERLMLHAERINLIHPITKLELKITAPSPF